MEQEFFEAFNLSKKEPCKYGIGCGHAKPCCPRELIYPPITSDIVLNLAIILNKEVFSKIECCCLFCGQSVEEITKNILDDCIDHQKDIYTQVRALFNDYKHPSLLALLDNSRRA